MFLPLCVCVSVCLSVSGIGQAQKVVQRILMIFGMKECATNKQQLIRRWRRSGARSEYIFKFLI